ncbi:glycoside hydrolase family 71 protein [Amylocystis lapponica]|nr:glycoside hydrolase family 71 protein [Amylocystis lapponica]
MPAPPGVLEDTGGEKKYVVAHFMVGNTYPYTVNDWLDDVRLAHSHGIDGFALNVGREEWQKARVSDCYEASMQSGLSFKLFLSFDMTSLPSDTEADAAQLYDYLVTCAAHPNQLIYDGKVFVSTFAGEHSRFGQPDLNSSWAYVKSVLEQVAPVHLVPSFFIDPARYPEMSSMDGYFHWNGGWPLHLSPDLPAAKSGVPSSTATAPTSNIWAGEHSWPPSHPGSSQSHYGRDSWNKNWIYRGDDWLFARRWEQLVAHRAQIGIVQILSWNDYGESHYVGPVKGAQPASHAWVDGFPHDAWLQLGAYYARAFKDGAYPPIAHDRIYMWARPHPKHARAPDTVARPRNWELTDDVFWVVVFAAAAATIVLSSSGPEDEDARAVEVPAGSRSCRIPCVPAAA